MKILHSLGFKKISKTLSAGYTTLAARTRVFAKSAVGSILSLTKHLVLLVAAIFHAGYSLIHRSAPKIKARFTKLRARSSKTKADLAHYRARTLGRLHLHLRSKHPWYDRWHGWRFHHHAHYGVVVAFVLGMALWIGTFGTSFASDLSKLWDFSVGGDYTTSTGAEIASSKARLKVQNYTTDASTVALYHLDDGSGSTATDSSGNSNALTLSNLSWGTGNLNGDLSFNGTSSYGSAASSSSLNLTGTNTIEAWTKFASGLSAGSHGSRQIIADKGNYQFYYDNTSGKLTYELSTGSTSVVRQGGPNSITGGGTNGSWDVKGNGWAEQGVFIGSDMYVGTGLGNSSGQVWKWNGTTWSMIGGLGVNGSWSNYNDFDVTLVVSGTMLYAGLSSNEARAEVWRYDSTNTTWTKIAGDGINSSWAAGVYSTQRSMVADGTTVYVGMGELSGSKSDVWKCTNCSTSPNWGGTTIAGSGVNSSWDTTHETVYKMAVYGTTLYAGLGATTGDAEVWSTSTSGTPSWTMIGGDGINSGWANATYEYVPALAADSSGNLYAGLGNGTGDGEVWKWGGSTWTKIGGDGLNSSWATTQSVRGLAFDGSNNVYASLGDGNTTAYVWKYNGSTWTQIGGNSVNSSWPQSESRIMFVAINGNTLYAGPSTSSSYDGQVWSTDLTTISWSLIGGDYVNNSWGEYGLNSVAAMVNMNGYLYAGTASGVTSSAGNALVWKFDGSTWTLVGGQGINSSWAPYTYEGVYSLTTYNGNLYAGLGTGTGNAEVWKYNGSSWSQVGGDSLNSSWDNTHETVHALAVFNGKMYAGIGDSTTDAEVWEYNGSAWSLVGGDGTNSSWNTNYEQVLSLASFNGELYAGIGTGASDGELWKWSGSGSWTKVGGGGSGTSGQSWVSTSEVDSLAVYNNKLYAGLGAATGAASVWECSSGCTVTTGWTKVGGDSVNSSWSPSVLENVYSLAVYNGELYAGTGSSASDGQVWKYNGTSWAQVASTSLTNLPSGLEYVLTMSTYQGKLYFGTGGTLNSDAFVYSYGGNAFLQSTTTSQDTNWHHVAATYDGTTMKLYIDGVLNNSVAAAATIPSNTASLLIGTSNGPTSSGLSQDFFSGQLDEVRLSNVARTSFTTTPFSASNETVQTSAAIYTSGVASFDSFADSEIPNGGTINFRLSSDSGTTWKYWGGSSWTTSSSLSNANDVSTVNAHISTFSVGSGGLIWQAVLKGNGNQQVTLNSVTLTSTSDTSAPNNPGTVTAKDSSGGSTTLTSGSWYNYTAPYFSWTPPTDPTGGSGGTSGVAGYYVYFGTDNTADPLTSGVFQTGANYTAGSMISGSTYYLRIKTKDNAGNVNATASSLFSYKLDTTAPIAIDHVNVSPVGCSTATSFNFTWPASTDAESGIATYEYKVGSTGTIQTTTALTIGAPSYQNGDNVFYVRVRDNAGNTSPFITGIYCSTSTTSVVDGPTVTAGPSSITVTWTSSKPTSSFVRVESGNDYVSEQGQSAFTLTHSVKVVGLSPEKSYNYKLVWTDESGNTGSTTSFTTTTATTPSIKNIKASILSPSSALLTWDTTELASATLQYGIGTYSTDLTQPGVATRFSQQLTNLTPGSAYQMRVVATTQDGYQFTSVVTLTTPPFPKISGVRFDFLKEAQATVRASWTTNVPSTSLVKYTAAGGETKVASSAEMVTDHSIVISNLLDNTTYSIIAQSTDSYGNTGLSDTQTYETPFDTRPPSISGLRVEVRSNGLGYTQKAQVVVSWETDEPSTSQIQYGPGIASDSYPSLSQEDASLSTTHVVIVSELEPSKLYHLRAVSKDRAGNVGNSVDTTIITGKIQQSAIDIIINSLQRSLNFLKKLPLVGR